MEGTPLIHHRSLEVPQIPLRRVGKGPSVIQPMCAGTEGGYGGVMHVRKLAWVGTHTDQAPATAAFFREVLGLAEESPSTSGS